MDGPDLPPAPPLLPKGMGDILNAAFAMYREQWVPFAKIVAIVAIPIAFVQELLNHELVNNTSSGVGERAWAAIILGLLGGLAYQVMSGAIARAAAGSVVGMPVDVDASYSYGFARLWSILLIGLLVGLAVGFGFILLFIPGVIFAVKFAVSVPVLVVENKRGTQAMSRSWELTTGQFWHVLGTFFVALLLAGLVSGILTAIFPADNWFLRAIGASIATIITAPFTAMVSILVYLDLRARKENLSSDRLRAELASSGA